MVNTNPTKLSRALSDAGFENMDAYKKWWWRQFQKGAEPGSIQRPRYEKGYFRHYTDYPQQPDRPVRHKYEIRTMSGSFADEAARIAGTTLPEATTHKIGISRVSVTWKQIGQRIV